MNVTSISDIPNSSINPREPEPPQQKADGISSDFETFLRMLTVQMQNQDPLNPIESSEYSVQLATFSSVEQQVKTNDLLENLGQQFGLLGLAQMSGWIGKTVRFEGGANFSGAPASMELPDVSPADHAELIATDRFGNEVSRIPAPVTGGDFNWPGLSDDGTPLADGNYTFRLVGYREGQAKDGGPVLVSGTVDEVRMEDGVQTVVLADGTTVSADKISAILQGDASAAP